MKNGFERLPAALAAGLAVLVVAACAIRLCGDESAPQYSESLTTDHVAAAKLEQCLSVTYEQKEALSTAGESGPSGAASFWDEANPLMVRIAGRARPPLLCRARTKTASRPALPRFQAKASEPRAARALSISFWKSSPTTSIPDLAWSEARSVISPPH